MSTFPVEHWSDKVMSVLREQQLEACQERLALCHDRGIFDDIPKEELNMIFQGSYLSQEYDTNHAPSLESVRKTVLETAEKEAAFLSEREDTLIKRMIISQGKAVLTDWEDVSAAEALVKRMWCTISIDDEEDTASLCLQKPLMEKMIMGMSSENYSRVRQEIFRFTATVHALLYLSGFLHAAVPAKHFEEKLKEEKLPCESWLIHRFMKSAFEYYRSDPSCMLLVHPGLYDPEHLVSTLQKMGAHEVHLTPEMMLGGMNGVLPEEVASSESMNTALQGAVRPELDEKEVLEDLRMMAKQGASLPEMREVLESCLCVMPTPRMLSALKQLHLQTVRWIGMPSAVLN